jgi:pyruvate dehydrogenase E1 component alpha subunit
MIAEVISANLRLSLHKDLLRVRQAEQTLAERYKEQEMRTPTHFGVGQEAVAVGVCGALTPEDVAYSHHRSHNHFLAKGGSVYKLAAELYGRETGCSLGRGGSVHLTDLDCGFVASSAILGETIATAVGSALSFAMDGLDRVAVSFFGDAVAEEGILYECLNFASIKKLPVLLVCENNTFATESPLSVRQPAETSLCDRVRSFKIEAENVDGNDVVAVFEAAHRAVEKCRRGEGPVFLECMTYRWLEHVGPYFDHELDRTYRTQAEVQNWQDRCPVKRSGESLIADGLATTDELESWEREAQ